MTQRRTAAWRRVNIHSTLSGLSFSLGAPQIAV
jgi:hypothetical protein